ncbi:MAG: transposase [Sumerlaeia bacterium]
MQKERSASVPLADNNETTPARETLALPFLDPFEAIQKHRHRLPHWQQGEAWQFVTWRLGDSLPSEKLKEWRLEKECWVLEHPEPWDPEEEKEHHRLFSERMERWLDAGHGCCALREKEAAAIVEGALRFFDGVRYGLGPFVIMPNHVHVLFQPMLGWPLEEILHSWKSFTAKEVNKLRGTEGPFWQKDYWDRMVRNEEQWHAYRSYIERNPVKLKAETFVLGVGTRKRPL